MTVVARNLTIVFAIALATQQWFSSSKSVAGYQEFIAEETFALEGTNLTVAFPNVTAAEDAAATAVERETRAANSRGSGNTTKNAPAPELEHPDKEKLFYQTHLEFMKQVPKSEFLLWDGRKRFRVFRDHFSDEIFTVSKSYKPPPPNVSSPLPDNANDRRIIYFPDWLGFCTAAKIFAEYRKLPTSRPWPHVTFLQFHEDTGGLSGTVNRKTLPRQPIQKKWKRMGCSQKFLDDYLNHPDTLAVVTSQHHMFDHPKAHSIPIGLRYADQVNAAYSILHNNTMNGEDAHFQPRKNWLMLSHNNGRDRPYADRYKNTVHVMRTFRVENTIRDVAQYYLDLAQSTFILSPPGAGWDCYRTWEALAVGTIPIVEHNNRKDGMYRSYQDLPIAWIDSYQNLTKDWLHAEHTRLLERADSYQWAKTTKQYWFDWLKGIMTDAGLEVKSDPQKETSASKQ